MEWSLEGDGLCKGGVQGQSFGIQQMWEVGTNSARSKWDIDGVVHDPYQIITS
jgi:hypothetical protein